jgi:hypothetical protein
MVMVPPVKNTTTSGDRVLIRLLAIDPLFHFLFRRRPSRGLNLKETELRINLIALLYLYVERVGRSSLARPEHFAFDDEPDPAAR